MLVGWFTLALTTYHGWIFIHQSIEVMIAVDIRIGKTTVRV